MKKVLALMMALLMTVSLLPVSAFAVGIGDGDNGVTPETLPAEDTAQDSEPDIVGNEDQDAEKDGTPDDGNAPDGAEKNGNAVENAGEGDTSAAITGISGPKTDVKDTCTLTIEDNKYFDVTGAGRYGYGEKVTITATPKHAGVVFRQWLEATETETPVIFSSNSTYSFNIDRDITLEIADDPAYAAYFNPGEDNGAAYTVTSHEANTAYFGFVYFTADSEGNLQLHFPEGDCFEAPEGKIFECWELDGRSYAPGDTLTLIKSGDVPASHVTFIDITAKWKDFDVVWVNGEQFSAGKLTINCGDGTASYDPDTATLTLDGAEITQTHEFDVDSRLNSGIFADGDLTVKLVGSSSIQLSANNATSGVVTEGNLVVTGTGDLIVSVDPGDMGIYASDSLTISGSGNVKINCENVGFCSDYVTINGSANVTVTALETWTSSFTLLGSGDVDITGNHCGIELLHGGTAVQLKGSGKLTIHSGNGYQAVYNEDNPESLVMLENPDNYTVMGAPDTDYVSYVPSTAYDVWVNGVQFTSARLAIDCGGGTAIYDPDTATLKLDGAQITQTHKFTDGMSNKTSSAIYAKGDLKVNRVGESRIEPISDAASGSGIYVEGELVITGTKDLAIYSDGESCGIWASSLTISDSGYVNIYTDNIGIYANTAAVKDSVNVNVDSGLYGVFTRIGSFSLLGSGDVFISGDENGVVLWDDCTVQLNGTGNLKITAGSGKKAVYNEDNPESLVTLQNPDNYVVTGTPDSDYVYYEYSPFRNLWVNGEQFSAEKLTIDCGSGTATYDPDTATLTLDGAEITTAHEKSAGIGGAIYAEQTLTVKVIGESTISLGEYATGDGIYTTGNLTITGDKALNISTGNEYVDAVWVNGADLTVNMNGALTVTAAGTALSATGNVTLAGNGSSTINAGADANGIYSSGGDITLSGSGNVMINAGSGIYAQTGNTELAGNGDIVIDAKKDGFKVIGNLTVGGSGKLTVDAGTYGILCNDMIFTDERTADITAGVDGIVPAGEIELGGSGDITITAEVYGINVYYNGDVYISGSGKLTVNAGYNGIVSYNGAILSGSGEVEIYGKENAVYFDNVQGAVRLDGTGSPITLRADQGKKAVYNITTNQSPIAGTAFDDYKCVTGAPNTASVVYRLEHSYGEATYTWDNNQCTAARSCTVCKKTETETATGIYVEDSPAFCTECAKGHYKALFFNDEFENQTTEANSVTHGSPLGHDWGAWTSISETQHQRMCKRDETHKETAAHTWDDGEVTTPATHMTEGVMTYTCTKCDATKNETIAKLTVHVFDQELVDAEYLKSAATCTEAAVYFKSCICGETGIETFTSGEALSHSYGNPTYQWNNDKCTAAHTCTVCTENVTGHTETETVTGTYVKDTDATCTTAEGGHYEVSFENEDFTAQQTAADSVTKGNPLGHSFPDTWEQHNAEQHKHTCTRCGTEVEYADHNFDGNTCKDCGYVKGNTYTIIAGGNGKWTKGSTAGLAFTSNAPFAKFDSVQVDGHTVAASNYTAVEGSTKITLAPAYLKTLSVGSHSIKIVSNDGSASTNFSVNAAAQPPADSSIPKTGDNSHMTLWVILLAASSAALTGTAIYNRKKKYRAK